MNINQVQPPDLYKSPAFSQAIEVAAPAKMLFIGGQNAIYKQGNLVGPNDFAAQAKQALLNIKSILDHAGYSINNVVDLTIFYTNGNNGRLGFQAFHGCIRHAGNTSDRFRNSGRKHGNTGTPR